MLLTPNPGLSNPNSVVSSKIGDFSTSEIKVAGSAFSGEEFNGDAKVKHKQRRNVKAKLGLTLPSGVLAVHIKQISLQPWNAELVFDQPSVNLYVRIIMGQTVKWTCCYEAAQFPGVYIIDEIKHFTTQLTPTRSDEHSNNIRLELIGFDRPDVHHIVAKKQLHLYNILKRLYASDSYTMLRFEKVVAKIDVEFCFAYGSFGYGYSNQLENRKIPSKDQIAHSMFCRLEPPLKRVHDDPANVGARDVMTCIPVGHPEYIPFTCHAHVGDIASSLGSNHDFLKKNHIDEPVHLITKMRKRLRSLQQEFSEQSSRKARITWLRKLVYNEELAAISASEEFQVPSNFTLKRRQCKGLRFETAQVQESVADELSEADDPKTARAKSQVEYMARVLEHSPGVSSARTRAKPEADEYTEQEKSVLAKIVGTLFGKKVAVTPGPEASTTDEVEEPPPARDFKTKDKWKKVMFAMKTTQVGPEQCTSKPVMSSEDIKLKSILHRPSVDDAVAGTSSSVSDTKGESTQVETKKTEPNVERLEGGQEVPASLAVLEKAIRQRQVIQDEQVPTKQEDEETVAPLPEGGAFPRGRFHSVAAPKVDSLSVNEAKPRRFSLRNLGLVAMSLGGLFGKESEVKKPAPIKFAIPRVMIVPPTPETSDEEDFFSDEDDSDDNFDRIAKPIIDKRD